MGRKLILSNISVSKQRPTEDKIDLAITGLEEIRNLLLTLDLNKKDNISYIKDNIIYLRRFYEGIERDLLN